MVNEGKGDPLVDFHTIDDVIDFAIGQEIKAAEFYRKFGKIAEQPGVRKMCAEMAEEEDGHKRVLEDLKGGLAMEPANVALNDLKISDSVRSFYLDPDADHQQLLVAAMKSEAKAEQLYRDLAARCTTSNIKKVLLRLAAEEGAHKDIFEQEYDDNILD